MASCDRPAARYRRLLPKHPDRKNRSIDLYCDSLLPPYGVKPLQRT